MRPHKIQVYRARDGWRWRIRATNSRIIAESGEAYKRKRSALSMAERIREFSFAVVKWEVEE